MNKCIMIVTCLILSSCSPFGGQSLVEGVGSSIADLFSGESQKGIVSGSTQIVETNPGLPAQNYKVSVSVGRVFDQPAVLTNGGYSVRTTIE